MLRERLVLRGPTKIQRLNRAAGKNGGYALLNRGPHHYEYDNEILITHLSITYRGTRCNIIPTEHNKAQLIATKCPHHEIREHSTYCMLQIGGRYIGYCL